MTNFKKKFNENWDSGKMVSLNECSLSKEKTQDSKKQCENCIKDCKLSGKKARYDKGCPFFKEVY